MQRILGICDSDQYYGLKLMEYIQSCRYPYEVCLFTSKECLNEHLNSNELDLLFIEEELFQKDIHEGKIKEIYLLINSPKTDQDVDYSQIFKYQSVTEMLKGVFSPKNFPLPRDNPSLTRSVGSEHAQLRIHTLLTPSANVNSLAFAWALAFSLSINQKVLLIPLEIYPTSLLSFDHQVSQGISEMIYHLKENPNHYNDKLNATVKQMGNLYYLSGITHGFDLLSLDTMDMNMWVKTLQEKTDYDAILFYVSFTSPGVEELMKLSDHLLLITLNLPYDKRVLEEWKRQHNLVKEELIKNDKVECILLSEDTLLLSKSDLTLQELQSTFLWEQAQGYAEENLQP